MDKRSCFQTFDVHDKHCQCCVRKREKSLLIVFSYFFECFRVRVMLRIFFPIHLAISANALSVSLFIQRHNETTKVQEKHNFERPCCCFLFLLSAERVRCGGKMIRNAGQNWFIFFVTIPNRLLTTCCCNSLIVKPTNRLEKLHWQHYHASIE